MNVRRRVRAAAAVAVALLALSATACGVGEDGDPELIARENVPHNLLDPAPVSTSTSPEATRRVTVYLAETSGDTTRLRAAEREVPLPVTVRAVLEALFEPLTERERDRGLTTFIVPEQAGVNDAILRDDGTVVVDLRERTLSIQGAGLRAAFAQIVYTLTELSGVRRVSFRVDGEAVPAIAGDGTQRDRPVNRSAYRSLAPD